MMHLQELFSEALREPTSVISYHVSRHLAETYPERAVLEGNDCDFDLPRFVKAGRCTACRDETIYGQVAAWWWDGSGILDSNRNVWYEVDWEGHYLDVIFMDWQNGCSSYHWVMAESQDVARKFYTAVCSYAPEVVDELMVFDGGHWSESGRLFDQIGGSTVDNLILPEKLKNEVFGDVARFFASKETYARYNAPWKRGLLFLGPPGNGKTHAIKALINESGRPALYIKSFDSEKWTESTSIRRVFERARKCAPCILILEDLDALVTEENRSFFLNELDGFASNVGVLTIATTNHPSKLDPAILNRPSRFDRKYHFGLPEVAERFAYIARWNASADPEMRLSESGLSEVAEKADGFSFAYLKELFLSSLMSWVAMPDPKTMDAVMLEQVASLKEQMESTEEARAADAK